MSASSLSLPIFLRINFLISYLIVTDSQNTFDWHTQRALLNDKKAGAGCTSRAFKHPGRDVTAPDVWPSILTDYTYDSELDNADGVPLAFRRSSMFPEGNYLFNNLTYERKIWYWSIVAQHSVIKIALFQKGLNNCSFQGVWKSPRKKWGVHHF